MIDHAIFVLPKKYYGGMEISNQKLMDYLAEKFSLRIFAYVHDGGQNSEPYNCDQCVRVSILSLYFSLYQFYKKKRSVLFVVNGVYPLLCMMLLPFKMNVAYQLHCTLDGNDEMNITKKLLLKILIAICSWRFYVYCVSESLADEVKKYKLSRKKSIVFSPNVLKNYKLQVVEKVSKVSFVGRISHQKDPLLAIDIVNQWIRLGLGVEASMVGGGHLIDLVKERALSSVSFPGWLDEPYSKGQAILFTSRYEGYGLVVIEALVNGCLVVARDAPHGPHDILKRIDLDMLVPYNSTSGVYVEKLKYLTEKYSSDLKCEQLKNSIRSYLSYLDDARQESWDRFFR